MVNIYILSDGMYELRGTASDNQQLESIVSNLIEIGVNADKIIISSGSDLIHRKMEIIEN